MKLTSPRICQTMWQSCKQLHEGGANFTGLRSWPEKQTVPARLHPPIQLGINC